MDTDKIGVMKLGAGASLVKVQCSGLQRVRR